MTHNLNNHAARIAAVRAVGAGIRMSETAVPEILASVPDGFDASKRGAVAELVHVWACGDDKRPLLKSGPKGEQVTTDYGRGHDTLTSAVKRALAALTEDAPKPVRLAVTMSGADAPVTGTVVIPADHALYAELVAMILTEQVESAQVSEAA